MLDIRGAHGHHVGFARAHLENLPVRGIVDDDRTVLEFFDTLVRYGKVVASAVA